MKIGLSAVAVLTSGLTTPTKADVPVSSGMLNAESMEEFVAAAKEAGSGRSTTRQVRRRNQSEEPKVLLASDFGGSPGFYHGVASGDPLEDAVILWTRYTPESADDVLELEYRIAEVDSDIPLDDHLDPSKNKDVRYGLVVVEPESDWVAKLDVTGLKSRTHYVFAFTDGDVSSDVGMTMTAPDDKDDTEELTYAVFSCAHFSNGYFHSYDIASTIEDLDFWVHVGDYIYEYGTYGSYATAVADRNAMTLPAWEISELQDYRLRHATYVGNDEGLRNLRKRAPMMATWDDHELTNNAYGMGTYETTGGENHEEVCSANSTSPDADKRAAGCDRDEGPADVRYNNAARGYMEWMPLRRGPGTMGVITYTSLTQVIEWGDLATFVTFDTRVTARSAEPTLASVFAEFGAAYVWNNVTAYFDETSVEKQTFDGVAASVKAKINDPQFSMIGEEQTDFLQDVFKKSKKSGKPWQIFAAATMMGPNVPPNMYTMSANAPTESQADVQTYMEGLLASSSAGLFRAAAAMANTQTTWNRDDWNGFGHERAQILDVCKNDANNAIILGGDLHDSWAWTLYEGGNMTGTPVAVNLGAPGVTSPGWGPYLYPAISPIEGLLGGPDGVYDFISDGFEDVNPGLVYGSTKDKGFFAVKATKETHTTEYFHVDAVNTVSDYATARSSSEGITSDFYCGASLITYAGEQGSLEKQADCGVITFSAERPAEWSISVPASFMSGEGKKGKGKPLVNCGGNACIVKKDGKQGKSKTDKKKTKKGKKKKGKKGKK